MTISPLLLHVHRMADYNAWANRRLYEASLALPPHDYYAERPSFFGSIHNTLNHIILGDTVWWARFTGKPARHITRLNQILYADLPSLHEARVAKDDEIVAFAYGLDEAQLNITLHYTNVSGATFDHPLFPLLMHAHNHQAHHRGQVHQMLSEAGVAEPPELDLIHYLREIGL
ncbi:DinB family protein [Ferrovibrio sp.]|uniref:DinB family protein n=1 Tax=Ferrovibrio sp. TaxID=1917215 RepID=UPI0025C34F24|nr:DinB family protein [Ferrovibrio sp.]MBX3454509.1 DinB family protein [Ferrovibrio sp.]